MDFTGGVAETIELRAENYNEDETKRDELFHVLRKAIHNKSLMAAAIPVSPEAMKPEAMIAALAHVIISNIACAGRVE